MKLHISSEIRIEDCPKRIADYCEKNLKLDNPDFFKKQRLGFWTGNTPMTISLYSRDGNDITIPYGCLHEIWKMCEIKSSNDYSIEYHLPAVACFKGDIPLYDYQEMAVQKMMKFKCGILKAPCGSGKTQMGLELIIRRGMKALWLTHTEKLLEQSRDRLKKYTDCDVGTITAGKIDIGKDITFATVQTMSKIDPRVYRDSFDTIVVDECHHCVGSPTKMMMFYKVVSNCNARFKYGLTATLFRKDGLLNSVYSIIGPVRAEVSGSDVASKTMKAEYVPISINKMYDDNEYLDADGTLDYQRLIKTLSCDEERNKIIVDNILGLYGKRKRQLVLCNRVGHAMLLRHEILERNPKIKVSNIYETTGRRKAEDYQKQDVIIATYALAKEGLDIPDLDTLHMTMPEKDKTSIIQSVGRIERTAVGKKTPLAFDYIDVSIPYCVKASKKKKSIMRTRDH